MAILTALKNYRNISRPVLNLIAAQFCLEGVNTAFFLLLNYYMVREGYNDYEVAKVLSYRFLAVCLLAFPLGLYIKGRKLRPFFYAAAIGVPIFSHLMIFFIQQHWTGLLNYAAMGWGVGFTCMQVSALPYILLNGKKENHSEAFSLFFLAFSVTLCSIGITYFLVNQLNPEVFNEKLALQVVSTFAALALFFIYKIPKAEKLSYKIPFRQTLEKYDWPLVLRAVTPTLIIAIGAGFTIPVINLFFLNVHGVPSKVFSIMGSMTFLLVAVVMAMMPMIRRNFGYKIAITLFQGLSVLALLVMATTEYYQQWSFAVYIAIIAYVVRQPLMGAARPMTTELTMYYVGPRNQEIMSALNASIWSGSWFFSMQIFGLLRQWEFRYVTIFLITVVMYTIGVSWYAYLIYSYRKRTGKTGKEERRGKARKGEKEMGKQPLTDNQYSDNNALENSTHTRGAQRQQQKHAE